MDFKLVYWKLSSPICNGNACVAHFNTPQVWCHENI